MTSSPLLLLFIPWVVDGSYITPLSIVAANLSEYRPSLISVSAALPSCELPLGSGLQNGVCASVNTSQLSFCGEFLDYQVCQPPAQPLWPAWTVAAKDALLASQFQATVSARIAEEVALAKAAAGPDPQEEFVTVRFAQNSDCVLAFKRALCWANFPKCGNSQSYPVCQTSCENYFKACRFKNTDICKSNPLWPVLSPSPVSFNSTACTGGVKQVAGIAGGLMVGLLLVLMS